VATIADIVGEAAVSRRTFYEHFQTKADCLIALYESVSLEGLSVLAGQLNPKLDWREQVEDALRAYFAWMAQNPVLMRTLFVDILAIGPDGLKVRRSVHEQIADFISQTVNAASRKPPQLSRELSVALVGGIHELILQQSEKGDLSGLADLAKVAADFVRRVFSEAGN
jgi:AcrR family transcriptional regulator